MSKNKTTLEKTSFKERTQQARNVQPVAPGETIKRTMDYFGEYRTPLIIALVIWGIGPILNVVMTYMLEPIVGAMLSNNPTALTNYLILYGVIAVARLATLYIGQRMMMHMSQKVIHKLRADLFEHMMDLPISFFDQNKKGNIMSTYTNDVSTLEQALSQSLPTVLTSILSFGGTIIMMFVLDVRLTLIVLVLLTLMLLIARVIADRSAKNFRVQQSRIANLNGFTEEMLTGQKVIKVFNHEETAVDEFHDISDDLRLSSTKAATLSVIMFPVLGNLAYVMYALVAMIGAIVSINGGLAVETIVTFLQYTRTVSMPITRLANQMNMIVGAIAGAERIFLLLDEVAEQDEGVVDIEMDANNQRWWLVPQEDGSVEKVKVEGHIRFYDVDFGYLSDQQVLHDINLWAKPGQSIAFVGSTGAGKTTITNLINRFYEINDGAITFDGINIEEIKKDALRSTLGMVLQDVHLFKGTIMENIRYGRLNATDEEVIESSKAANAHSFIVRLPEGYDTMLATDGLNLSEGERQLISIARAAVSNPQVLILDEATSSVDTRLEKLIEQGMAKIREGKTTFSIAHRLSTVRNANAILVLESGRVIERGDHNELISRKGRYYELSEGKVELE